MKPIENTTGVRGVSSTRYPMHDVCAHPECDKPVESRHHIFGRPPGEHSASWFVELTVPVSELDQYERLAVKVDRAVGNASGVAVITIPHVTGLCGTGTTGHHGDLEEHRAWIKLEDGVFAWYDRGDEIAYPHVAGSPDFETEWIRLGPLNPQPGSREGKPKRTRRRGTERSNRTNVTVKIPKGFADGPRVWDELLGDGKEEGVPYGEVRALLDEEGAKGDNPVFEVICDALHLLLSLKGKR